MPDIAQSVRVFFQVVSRSRVAENASEVAAVGANFFETESDLIGYNRCRSREPRGGWWRDRATAETASLSRSGSSEN